MKKRTLRMRAWYGPAGWALGALAAGLLGSGCEGRNTGSRGGPQDGADEGADRMLFERGSVEGRDAASALPAGGTVLGRDWNKYVDRQISQILANNAHWGFHHCVQNDSDCNMEMQIVSSQTVTLADDQDAVATTPDPIEGGSPPQVNSYGWATFTVSPSVSATFGTNSCSVSVQYLRAGTSGPAVVTNSSVPYQDYWFDSYAKIQSNADKLTPRCNYSEFNQANAWLSSTFSTQSAADRPDVVTCNCPISSSGSSMCGEANPKDPTTKPTFAFNLGFFDTQAWYRVTVACGDAYFAYGDIIATAYAGSSGSQSCGTQGTKAVPMETLYIDTNNNGSIDSSVPAQYPTTKDDPYYVGGMCHTLPFVVGLTSGGKLNLTNTLSTGDVSPSQVHFSSSPPTLAAAARSSRTAGGEGLIDGSSSPPPSSALPFMPAESWEDNATSALAGRIDLNGDGFADFAVGAPGACVDHDGSSTSTCDGNTYNLNSGKVYVVFGAPSHLPGRNDLATANLGLLPRASAKDSDGSFAEGAPDGRASITLLGQQGNLQAGMAIAGGNFDGDTFKDATNSVLPLSDLAIGLPSCPVQTVGADAVKGRVVILFGKQWISDFPYGDLPLDANSLRKNNGIDAIEIEGAEVGGLFGRSLAVGDLDGDGKAELVIGAPYEDGGKGRVYVFTGADLAAWRSSYNGTAIDATKSAQLILKSDGKGGALGLNAAILHFDASNAHSAYADLALKVDKVPCNSGCVSQYRDEVRMLWGTGTGGAPSQFMQALTSSSTSDSALVVSADYTIALDQYDTSGLDVRRQLVAVPDVSGDSAEELAIGTPYYDVSQNGNTLEDAGAAWVILSRPRPSGTIPLKNGMDFTGNHVQMFPGSAAKEYMGQSIDAAVGGRHDDCIDCVPWYEVNLVMGDSGWNDTTSSVQSWDGRVLMAAINPTSSTPWTGGIGFNAAGAPAQWATLRVSDGAVYGHTVALVGNVDRDDLGTPEVLVGAKGSVTTGLDGCSSDSTNCSSDFYNYGLAYLWQGNVASF